MYAYRLLSQQPIDIYNKMHAAIADVVGTNDPAGLLVHLAYPTEQGYEILEVWESKGQLDAFTRDVVAEAVQRTGLSMEQLEGEIREFDVAEVVTPRVYTPATRSA